MHIIPATPQIDILVTAAEGQPVLVVEVKPRGADQTVRAQVATYAEAVGAEFVMIVDPHQILVSPTVAGRPQWERAVTLPSSSVLSTYTDAPSLERIEGFYLESLIEAWLRDFSFSWKSKRPPGYDELEKIGLAKRLQHSETHTQR